MPHRLVLEITEHAEVRDYAAFRRGIARLGRPVRLAVDDAGAGFASLRHILELDPAFVKLDISLIRGINRDPAKQALVAGMRHFARTTKSRLIAEGVETEARPSSVSASFRATDSADLLHSPRGRCDRLWEGSWSRHSDLNRGPAVYELDRPERCGPSVESRA